MNVHNTYHLITNYNLSTLEQSLVQNFNAISQALTNQNKEIVQLRQNIQTIKIRQIKLDQVHQEVNQNQTNSQINHESLISVKGENQQVVNPQIIQEQNQVKKQSQMVVNINIELIQDTIRKMNERITQLQINQSKNMKINSKKIRQIYCEVDSYQNLVEKNTNNTKMYELEVQKLRKQLNQYKLKKQSQIVRMLSTTQTENRNENQQIAFIVQKIQQLSNIINQLAPKVKLQEITNQIDIRINRINLQMKNFINSSELESSVTMLNHKITQIQNNKASRKYKKIKNQQSQNIQVQEDESIPSDLIEKNFQNQKNINKIMEQLKQIHHNISSCQNTIKINTNQIQKSINLNLVIKQKVQFASKSHQKFMHEMNTIYNGKFSEIQTQMIQSQQNIQKLANQIKFYQYQSRSETNTSVKEAPTNNDPKNIQFQNDIAEFKKKINKINFKIQNIQSDLLSMRSDFVKDIDIIKINVQRKADWESTKKAFNFFEEQVKEITTYINSNIPQLAKEEGDRDDSSLIAKKVWTCLVCDKQLKNYQGKLGELKFGSVFPARYESPRIGGYYKQSQGDKQYKALYLSKQRKEQKSLIQRGSRQILN